MDIVNISPKVSGPVSRDIDTAINPPQPAEPLLTIVESKFEGSFNIETSHTKKAESVFCPTVNSPSLYYEKYPPQFNFSYRSTLKSRRPLKDLVFKI